MSNAANWPMLPPQLRRMRRGLATVVACTIVALVASCAQVPTSGPVERGEAVVVDTGDVFVQASGPTPGASATEIVQGFIRAQAAGVVDGYVVAKEFLTARASREWDPTVRSVVYAGQLDVSSTTTPTPSAGSTRLSGATTDSVTVRVTPAATLSEAGVLVEEPGDSSLELTLRLTHETGEWRIDQVEPGTLISWPSFVSSYRQVPLYFLSPDNTWLVPDVRWYPQLNLATRAVAGLLAGPMDALRDAVTTAVPTGTTLAISAVTTDEAGIATIDVSTEFLRADSQERALARAQIEQTLSVVSGVRGIDVRVAGNSLFLPDAAVLQTEASQTRPLTAVQNGSLVTLSDAGVASQTQWPTVPEQVDAVATQPLAPQADPVGQVAALRTQDSTIWIGRTTADAPQDDPAPPSPEPADPSASPSASPSAPESPPPDDSNQFVPAFSDSSGVVAPSVDRFGLVWTASASDGLVVLEPDGSNVGLQAPTLEGRTIVAVRVALDGARVALITRGNSADSDEATVQIEVAGIVRDRSGRPTGVVEGHAVGAPIVSASDVAWVDATTLAVLGRSSATSAEAVHVVPLLGRTEQLTSVEHARAVLAGKGVRSVMVVTDEDELVGRTGMGASWSTVAIEVTAACYPG